MRRPILRHGHTRKALHAGAESIHDAPRRSGRRAASPPMPRSSVASSDRTRHDLSQTARMGHRCRLILAGQSPRQRPPVPRTPPPRPDQPQSQRQAAASACSTSPPEPPHRTSARPPPTRQPTQPAQPALRTGPSPDCPPPRKRETSDDQHLRRDLAAGGLPCPKTRPEGKSPSLRSRRVPRFADRGGVRHVAKQPPGQTHAAARPRTKKPRTCGAFSMRPRRLELPRTNRSTRPSTLRVYQFRHRRVGGQYSPVTRARCLAGLPAGEAVDRADRAGFRRLTTVECSGFAGVRP